MSWRFSDSMRFLSPQDQAEILEIRRTLREQPDARDAMAEQFFRQMVADSRAIAEQAKERRLRARMDRFERWLDRCAVAVAVVIGLAVAAFVRLVD